MIVLLGFLFWLNWRLTFIALVLLPLIATGGALTGKRVRRLTREYLEVNAEMTQVIEETTRAHQVIKIFGGQQYEKKALRASAPPGCAAFRCAWPAPAPRPCRSRR